MKAAALCLILPALGLAACDSSGQQTQPATGVGSFQTP